MPIQTMTTITITPTEATIITDINTAKELLFKNSKCNSTINGGTATLIYDLKELNKLTSLLNHR